MFSPTIERTEKWSANVIKGYQELNKSVKTYTSSLLNFQLHRISNERIGQSQTTCINVVWSICQFLQSTVGIPPGRMINLSSSALSLEVPRNCNMSRRRPGLYGMCQNSWNSNAREQNIQWFHKFQMTRKYIFPIFVVMDAIHFDTRGHCHWLHLHGHNTCGTGGAYVSQWPLIKGVPWRLIPLGRSQFLAVIDRS